MTILPINTCLLFRTVYKLACILFTQFSTVINFGHPYMMFDSYGHMQSWAVWKSFNQLYSWWLLCKRYAYTLIRVSRHYYAICMFLLCLCSFVSNKAFWSWSCHSRDLGSRSPKSHPVRFPRPKYFLCPKYLRSSSNGFDVKSKSHCGGGGGENKLKT